MSEVTVSKAYQPLRQLESDIFSLAANIAKKVSYQSFIPRLDVIVAAYYNNVEAMQ